MGSSKTSMFVFGLYLYITAAGLLLFPAFMLSTLAIPEPADYWIRVLGVVALALGYYYHQAARHELREFYRITITGRLIFLAGCTLLVLMSIAPAQLLVFGAIDAAAALWTHQTLAAEAKA